MLKLFFDSFGIIHVKFIPEGATVHKHCYKGILRRLCNSIRRKCPELWRRKNWMLLHDNAPAHRSDLVQEELAKQQVTVLPRPPYSPTHPISHHAISFFSPALKKSYVGDLNRPMRSSLPQGKSYGTTRQISFSSVSSSYTNTRRLS
jgi:hypothetical protein